MAELNESKNMKETVETKSGEKTKKLTVKQILYITIFSLILTLSLIALFDGLSKTNESNWYDNIDKSAIRSSADVKIKEQFNFPSTVKIKYPDFIYEPEDYNKVCYFIRYVGVCTAKNAFGLETEYTFIVTIKVDKTDYKYTITYPIIEEKY